MATSSRVNSLLTRSRITGDTLNVIQTDVTRVKSYASPLQTVMDSDPAKIVRQTISAIVDNIPPLLRVLDDVAQVHPFIKSTFSSN